MDDNTKDLDDFNIPLILTDEITIQSNKDIEILKIKNLIKLKYLNNIKKLPLNDQNYLNKNFDSIKDEVKKIECDIREKTISINQSIKIQEIELKKLFNEKELLNKNKIQSDIINNQQKLIDNYKKNNIKLKLNLDQVEKTLEKEISFSKNFLINNEELKTTINRYIIHNKKLQNNINQLKKDYLEASFSKSQINEMIVKIKFYQEENTRLSSELASIQKDYEITKNNLSNVENEKNNIYNQIKELNNSLNESKTIPLIFELKNNNNDSKNSDKLININNKKPQKIKAPSASEKDLDDQINDIFN